MGDLQYHIRCKPGAVGEVVLLPGDPGRVEPIARLLDSPRLIARNREYTTYTGTLGGRAVSVCSTGIGSPSTAIAVEELSAIGATTFIRVGTTGSIQRDVHFGDLVIATAAVRDEGTTPSYVPMSYPAVADFSCGPRRGAPAGAAQGLNGRWQDADRPEPSRVATLARQTPRRHEGNLARLLQEGLRQDGHQLRRIGPGRARLRLDRGPEQIDRRRALRGPLHATPAEQQLVGLEHRARQEAPGRGPHGRSRSRHPAPGTFPPPPPGRARRPTRAAL